jgi:hypothetical protein
MKLDEVPQDHSSTYGGHRKVIYAVDGRGRYTPAHCDGWETEAFATQLAVAELEQQAAAAHADWLKGRASPLPWLMYRCRMDETALAQATGLWRWRLRRHFQRQRFVRLGCRVLARYAEAFGMPLAELVALQQESRR